MFMRQHRRKGTYRYALLMKKVNIGQLDYKKSEPSIGKITTKSDAKDIANRDNKLPATFDYPYRTVAKRIKVNPKTLAIEKQAKKILSMDQAELDAAFKDKKKRLSPVIYNILEDLNAHTKNAYLVKLGVWGKPVYHIAPVTKERYVVPNQRSYSKGSRDFDTYRKHGGKTWEL
jgi:hypothetical protein